MMRTARPAELYGIPVRWIAQLAQVSHSTAKRWKRGQARMPFTAQRVIAQAVDGELGARAGAIWHGWTWGHDGLLYAPELARGFTPSDLHQLAWLLQMNAWRQAGTACAQQNGRPEAAAYDSEKNAR